MMFVGLLTFATIVTVASPFLVRSTLESRLNSVANRREELKLPVARGPGRKETKTASLRQTDGTCVKACSKTIVDRLQLSRLLEDSQVVDKLPHKPATGAPGRSPPSTSSV